MVFAVAAIHLNWHIYICLNYSFSIRNLFYFQVEKYNYVFDFYVCDNKSTVSRMAVFNYCLGLVIFIVPLIIIIHNYTRVSHTLVKSLKQNTKLMEGNEQE